ncbi:hypothetical protein ACZ87_02081 [Candidatus Erwinia dacicola]|uniref:Uncharacterized protein n=1 Tax=Candidatus Erwinia dacicola TaxID=252393 RepID=A0A328TTL2_9GAMM|nr:hypothetical protein ACZ87_02081 [Candidatus Erwinia dacicola]
MPGMLPGLGHTRDERQLVCPKNGFPVKNTTKTAFSYLNLRTTAASKG